MLTKTHVRARVLSRLGIVSLVTFGLVAGAAAAPAGAHPATHSSATTQLPSPAASRGSGNTYVALGDSFTGGQGAPPYLPGPCLQSKFASYPTIAASLTKYRLVANKACSGASIAAVPGQLAGVDPKTKLVTLTVGGIDAGSNLVFAACAPDPASPLCDATLAGVVAGIPSLKLPLQQLYATIAEALPHARVVVLNYPRLFNPGVLPLGDRVNPATDALNATIAEAVAATGNRRISLVDVTQEFAGHGIGSATPFINFDPANPLAAPNLHPNALGNLLGYARALANDKVFRR